MAVRATPVHDARGRVVEWVGMNADVTEQREAEEALRRSEALLQERTRALEEGDRRKDEFLAMLAHELRNTRWPRCATPCGCWNATRRPRRRRRLGR